MTQTSIKPFAKDDETFPSTPLLSLSARPRFLLPRELVCAGQAPFDFQLPTQSASRTIRRPMVLFCSQPTWKMKTSVLIGWRVICEARELKFAGILKKNVHVTSSDRGGCHTAHDAASQFFIFPQSKIAMNHTPNQHSPLASASPAVHTQCLPTACVAETTEYMPMINAKLNSSAETNVNQQEERKENQNFSTFFKMPMTPNHPVTSLLSTKGSALTLSLPHLSPSQPTTMYPDVEKAESY